jgi:hypothetical protein
MPKSPRRMSAATKSASHVPPPDRSPVLPGQTATPPPPPDWTHIRQRYESTDAAIADICSDNGITKPELERARKKGRWRRSMPRPFPAFVKRDAATSAAPPSVTSSADGNRKSAAKKSVKSSLADRRRLVARLVAAISTKLEQLEKRMAHDLGLIEQGDAATATDHERETRAIGALIDNLGKVTDMETGFEALKPGARAGAKSSAASAHRSDADLADEAERSRRELSERLARLVKAAGV